MARTVTYPPKSSHSHLSDAERSRLVHQADGYREKIVKYVPAEVLAFVIPLAHTDKRADVRLVFWLGVIATPILLFAASRTLEAARRPRFWFYGLALIAYWAWAIGTNTTIADVWN